MNHTQTPAAPIAATACTPPTCTGSAVTLAVLASSGAGECSLHLLRREARVSAIMKALSGRYDTRFVLVQNASWGPCAYSFLVRPDGRINRDCEHMPESLYRVRSAA